MLLPGLDVLLNADTSSPSSRLEDAVISGMFAARSYRQQPKPASTPGQPSRFIWAPVGIVARRRPAVGVDVGCGVLWR